MVVLLLLAISTVIEVIAIDTGNNIFDPSNLLARNQNRNPKLLDDNGNNRQIITGPRRLQKQNIPQEIVIEYDTDDREENTKLTTGLTKTNPINNNPFSSTSLPTTNTISLSSSSQLTTNRNNNNIPPTTSQTKRATTSTFSYCTTNSQTPSIIRTGCGCIPLAKLALSNILFGLQKAGEGLGKCLEGCCNCGFCGASVGAAQAGGGVVGGLVGTSTTNEGGVAKRGGGGGVERKRSNRKDMRRRRRRRRSLEDSSPRRRRDEGIVRKRNAVKEEENLQDFAYCVLSSSINNNNANKQNKRASGGPSEGQVVPDIDYNNPCQCIPAVEMLAHGIIFGLARFRSWIGGCWGGGCCGGGSGGGDFHVKPAGGGGHRRRREVLTLRREGRGEEGEMGDD
ncbi:MAG: hypothetical protein M1812_005225 [Candelaria pacifica]|nr:MAG: hypothetical protein M1812_005225 [Candelaria pacifica]